MHPISPGWTRLLTVKCGRTSQRLHADIVGEFPLRASIARIAVTAGWSMIPKKLGPDVIRAGYRFSEKIMLQA